MAEGVQTGRNEVITNRQNYRLASRCCGVKLLQLESRILQVLLEITPLMPLKLYGKS